MSWYFWGPIIAAAAWGFIWVCAAVGYGRGESYPRTIAAGAFGGPIRDYVLPGGFFAALACLLTTILVERVAAYPPMAQALQAAAILFTCSALLGLLMYQSLENLKSGDGLKITIKSAFWLAVLGLIYAILTVAIGTIMLAIVLALSLPPAKPADPAVTPGNPINASGEKGNG